MEPASLAAMGGELRSRRRAREISRAALAQAVGTRPVIVGRWERGEAVPTPAQAQALAGMLDLPPAAAAGWLSAAEQVATETGRGWRLPDRRGAGWPGPAGWKAGPRPGPGASSDSYLDDAGERRRYALRWALTLLILGALAIGLIWALGALADGWGALVDVFRDGPPTTELTGAMGRLWGM